MSFVPTTSLLELVYFRFLCLTDAYKRYKHNIKYKLGMVDTMNGCYLLRMVDTMDGCCLLGMVDTMDGCCLLGMADTRDTIQDA